MKKLFMCLFAAAMALAAGEAAAQEKTACDAPEKGWWLGGEVGYWNDEGENTFTIAPKFGYDFNRHWAIGASVGFVGVDDAMAFEFAPYARWKFYNIGRLTLFLDGGIGVVLGDIEGFKVGFQPGLDVRISDHFKFLAHVGFLGYCNEFYNNGGGNGFGLRFSSSDLKFGFYYTF